MQFSVYWLVISFLLFAWHFIAPQVPSVSGALTFVQLMILVLIRPPCCFATVLLLPPPFCLNWPHYGIRFHVIGLVARVYLRIQIKIYIHTYKTERFQALQESAQYRVVELVQTVF